MEQKRNYGIDLLRIVLMFMVCTLHVLAQGGILNACAKGSLKASVFWFLEIFSYCAVDAFAIISGYVASNREQKYDKIVNMWFQIFFYSFVITILFVVFGFANDLSMVEIIKNALPITFNKFWYITAYFGLFFTIPILNKFISVIDKKTAQKAIIIIFVLFSIIGFIVDAFRTSNGYSAFWLIILYCLGALANKSNLFENKKSIILIIIWFLCIIVTWVTYIYFGTQKLISYISPTILMSGIIMVILFSRIKLKGNIISKLSPLALGIYLLQLNQVIWSKIIKDAFVFVVDKKTIIGILWILILSSIISISGMLVESVRRWLFKLIKIPLLSQKIVEKVKKILDKAVKILN